jgi:hypothetical protein
MTGNTAECSITIVFRLRDERTSLLCSRAELDRLVKDFSADPTGSEVRIYDVFSNQKWPGKLALRFSDVLFIGA